MALISVDVRRQIGQIDHKIYGGFIEHLGKCIYGGIYDPGSSLADERGFRTDVMEAVRRLRMPIIRWPGGNFASGYHWEDGVEPGEKRPRRPELAWHTIESNQFGTNEFIQWCHAVGTEPYICTNLGNGTMDEAAAWVEYCNGTEDSHYANLRRAHGYDAPHKVIYWGLGNEIYGDWQIGHKSAQDYAKAAREFAKVMKWTDPDIKVVACGGQNLDWDREVLQRCADLIDYISYHAYWRPEEEADSHYSLLWGPHYSERYLGLLGELIEYVRREQNIAHRIGICADEWNVWYRAQPATEREVYDLTDALCVGTFLNILQRDCMAVGIANLAQVVNVIAPIWADPDGLLLQTIFWPFYAASTLSGPVALDVHCESDGFAAPAALGGRLPYLDVSATLDKPNNTLFISVVNRHKAEAIEAQVEVVAADVAATSRVHLITGEAPAVVNSFEEPDNVTLRSEPLEVPPSRFTHTFPAHSMTVLELALS